MSHKCEHCNDTGSLSKDLYGYLDCTHCGVAKERAELQDWAYRRKSHAMTVAIDHLWLIYQHGRNKGLEEAAQASDNTDTSSFDSRYEVRDWISDRIRELRTDQP